MHNPNEKINVLIFASEYFNNSFIELKEHFNFNLDFFIADKTTKLIKNYSAFIIEEEIIKDKRYSSFLKNTAKPKVLISTSEKLSNIDFDIKVVKPINIYDLNKKVIDLIKKKEFRINSFIELKDYILDKNEKKLKKDNLFIFLTEKEIQLLELLFKKKKPIKKTYILRDVWKYSNSADTHTVETHIYRLRKKIFNKFNDNNFILNSKSGYFL